MNKQIEETDLKVLIYNIIKRRISKFNFEEIDNIIKQELETKNIHNKDFLSKTLYYDNTLLEVLEFLMEREELHFINGWYVPKNALPKQNYQVQNIGLAYSYGLIRGNDHYIDDIEYLYDVETTQKIINKDRKKRAILTRELIGGGDYEQPKVPLYEITNLYQKLKTEGASQKEIIQYILNYYDAVSLDEQIFKKYPNRYKITPKIKKKALISIN